MIKRKLNEEYERLANWFKFKVVESTLWMESVVVTPRGFEPL